MVTPNHPRRAARALTSRPMPSGAAAGAARPLGRRAGNIVLACALSLSMVPSLAFAEEAETAEGESIELVAETAAAAEPTTESAPTTKTEATKEKAEEKAEGAKAPEKPESSDKTNKTEGTQQSSNKTEAAAPTATETPAAPEAEPSDAAPATPETPTNDATAQNVELTEGVTYEGEAALLKADGTPSGAARYIEKTITVVRHGAVYIVTFSVTTEGQQYITEIEDASSLGEGHYALRAASIDDPLSIKFKLTTPMGAMTQEGFLAIAADSLTEADSNSVDKSGLQGVLAAAKRLTQGQKSDAAWKTLQDAIKAAEAVLANDSATEDEVTQAAASVGRAMKAFNESENVGGTDQPTPEQPGASDSEQTPKPPVQAEDGAVGTPGGFYLVKDKAYPVKASTTSSMINQMSMLDEDATVVWNGSAYVVTIGFQGTMASALKGITYEGKQAQALGNNRFSFEASDIAKGFHLAFNLGSPAPEMTVEGDIMLDTTSLPTESGKPIESEKPTPKPEGDSNQNANNSGATNNSSTKAEKFQVGHTYRVPISFTKQGSSTTSMAAKYFGDTALVRPRANGTFDVTFAATSEGLKYINALKYKGANLKRSGNQFTVNIPAASGDTTVPIVMDISMLRDLGLGDAVTADMHLYLSRAEDLGTGKDGAQASSNAMLAQTGDAEDATGLALAAMAAGAVAVACRRRLSAE